MLKLFIFLEVCWFLSISVYFPWKLYNPYCHIFHIAPISQDKVEPFFIHFFYFLHAWRNKKQVLSINCDPKVDILTLGLMYCQSFHDFKPMFNVLISLITILLFIQILCRLEFRLIKEKVKIMNVSIWHTDRPNFKWWLVGLNYNCMNDFISFFCFVSLMFFAIKFTNYIQPMKLI